MQNLFYLSLLVALVIVLGGAWFIERRSLDQQDYEEIDEEDLRNHWICFCGRYITDGCHCPRCWREPPWGCPCSACQDGEDEDDSDYDYEDWDEPSEWEIALGECGKDASGFCQLAGTEQCDECPFQGTEVEAID